MNNYESLEKLTAIDIINSRIIINKLSREQLFDAVHQKISEEYYDALQQRNHDEDIEVANMIKERTKAIEENCMCDRQPFCAVMWKSWDRRFQLKLNRKYELELVDKLKRTNVKIGD